MPRGAPFDTTGYGTGDAFSAGTLAPGSAVPIVRSVDVKGGAMQVADLAARDAIPGAGLARDDPAQLRQEGMLVYVDATGLTYQLQGGITNGDWVALNLTGGAQDWASVLGVGATSGGTNPTLSGGDSYRSAAAWDGRPDPQAGAGSTTTLAGGESTGSTGGDLRLRGGDGVNDGAVRIGDVLTALIELGAAAGVPINLIAGTGQDVTFNARGGSLTYNDAGNAALVGAVFSGVGSIVGALNALAAALSTAANQTSYTNANASPITQGQACYVSAAGAVDLATAAVATALAAEVHCFVADASIAAAAAGNLQLVGTRHVARLEGGLTVNAGDRLYLSATTPGSLTNVAPSALGTARIYMGVIVDTLTYDGGADLLVEIQSQRGNKLSN